MSAAVALSRITGLVRERMLAQWFGTGTVYEAYLVGFRIPNLTRDLFAEGALSAAFVPQFTEYLAKGDRAAAQRLANLVASALVMLVGTMCLIGIAFAPALVEVFASGFHRVPGKFELAIHMTRVMFPFLLLVALAAQVMGILNACNRFLIPALSSSIFNITSVALGLLLGFTFGPSIGLQPVEGMAWGVVTGGFLQFACQLPELHREGFRLRPAIDWSDPGLRHIGRMMGPAILGGAAVQVNNLVNTNLASQLVDPVRGADGPVGWLSLAFRLMQLPIGLFGVAIANATLPAISRSVASGDQDEFRQTLSRSLGFVFLLTVPSAVGLAVLGRPVISAIFEGGKFESYDTHQTALALSFYSLGLVGYSVLKVLNPAFYAMRDSRTPMYVSLGTIAVNYAAATLLLTNTGLGHVGLALALSVVSTFSGLVQFVLMRNRIGGIHGRSLASSLSRIVVASAAMGIAVSWINFWMEARYGLNRVASLTSVALCIPAGFAIYYGVCRLLAVPELSLATGALRRSKKGVQKAT